MVKEYTIAGVYALSLTVIDSKPVCIEFTYGVRAAWVEIRCLIFLYAAGATKKLSGAGLKESRCWHGLSNSLQQARHAYCVYFRG